MVRLPKRRLVVVFSALSFPPQEEKRRMINKVTIKFLRFISLRYRLSASLYLSLKIKYRDSSLSNVKSLKIQRLQGFTPSSKNMNKSDPLKFCPYILAIAPLSMIQQAGVFITIFTPLGTTARNRFSEHYGKVIIHEIKPVWT